MGKMGEQLTNAARGSQLDTLELNLERQLLWRRKPSGGALGKLSVAWSNGVFLGIKGLSGEVLVSDSRGVYKFRTVHRRPISDRWDIASSDFARYAPWEVNENDEKADGEALVSIKLTDEEIADQVREKGFDLSDTAAPRRFKITKRMLVEH